MTMLHFGFLLLAIAPIVMVAFGKTDSWAVAAFRAFASLAIAVALIVAIDFAATTINETTAPKLASVTSSSKSDDWSGRL